MQPERLLHLVRTWELDIECWLLDIRCFFRLGPFPPLYPKPCTLYPLLCVNTCEHRAAGSGRQLRVERRRGDRI